jgi:hypothetical protein
MRALALFTLVIFLSTGVTHAQSIIVNDSNSIDLEGTILPSSGESSGSDSGGGLDTSGGAGGSTDGDFSSGSTIESVTVVFGSGSSPSGNSAPQGTSGASASPGSSGANGNSSGQGGDSVAASDILGTLIGNQAVSISGGGGSGLPDQGGGTVLIHASLVRAALHARGIGAFLIPGFDTSKGISPFGRFLALKTNEDFALVAASTALKDGRIEDITLAAGTLHISYRARGNLFAFIPVTYRIVIEAKPDPAPGTVTVKFPWYKFFLRTYVSKKDIEADVGSTISSVSTEGGTLDERARLLNDVSAKLSARFDTVEGSIAAN